MDALGQGWLTIFGAVLPIFGVIAAGTLLRRLNWLTEEADQSLLAVVINLLVPCFFLSIIVGNERLRDPSNVWLPPLVGFATTVLGFAAALALARFIPAATGLTGRAERGTFAFCVGVYNYGYLPLPLALVLFDEGTVGVLAVHNIGVDLALWTVGIVLLAGSARTWWKGVVNPPSLSILAALALNATLDRWRPLTPDFVADGVALGVGMLGNCAIPMALLLIGATIGDHLGSMHVRRGKRVIAAGLFLRIGLLPAAFLAMAWLLTPVASAELRRVMILQAAMPAAVMPIVLAKHYGGDVPTALRVVLATSAVGLVTIPLWVYAGLELLPT